MKTRSKLYIASYTASLMMLANVFSKPLRIPEPLTWVLLLGVFIPLALIFRFIKQLKLETQAQPAAAVTAVAQPATDPQRGRKSSGLVWFGCRLVFAALDATDRDHPRLPRGFDLWYHLRRSGMHHHRLQMEEALTALINHERQKRVRSYIICRFLALLCFAHGQVSRIPAYETARRWRSLSNPTARMITRPIKISCI